MSTPNADLALQPLDNSKPLNKVLVLTCGLPRSGKTTWSQAQGVPIVCPDAIRLALHGERFIKSAEDIVWAHARLMAASLFEAGHNTVIVDSTMIRREWRDKWRDSRWRTVFRYFSTPPAVCEERARATGRDEIIDIIWRMAGAFEPLSDDEIFDEKGDLYGVLSRAFGSPSCCTVGGRS